MNNRDHLQSEINSMEKLNTALMTADSLLNKSYLSRLHNYNILKELIPIFENEQQEIDNINSKIRFFKIEKIVLNNKENMRDKLVSVFNAIGSTGGSLLVYIKGTPETITLQFGTKNIDPSHTMLSQNILEKSIKGNFPGTIITRYSKKELKEKIIDTLSNESIVASVTDIAGLRANEENNNNNLFIQGLEKIIDALREETYSLLVIAEPVSQINLEKSRSALERLSSALMPFSEEQRTIGTNESSTITDSLTNSINQSVTESISHTVGESETSTSGTNSGSSFNPGVVLAGAGAAIGSIVPGAGTVVGGMIGGAVGSVLGMGLSFNDSENSSISSGTTESDTESKSNTSGTSESKSKSIGTQTGSNESVQIKFENKSIKEMLKRIDKILERYNACSDLGMWNCAAYCISDSEYVSQMAASVYQSHIRGKNSSLENSAINVWSKDKSKQIIKYLKRMEHPLLDINGEKLTPGTLISSAELAIHAGLPMHSVPGLPVIECAEFGRTVSNYNQEFPLNKYNSVQLGHIWHMNQEEELPVILNPDALTSHVFITGSTGSGKSNTVYKLLSELKKLGKKFLVIEPAKGEYKHVFGNEKNVSVYGTNPDLMPLLRLNPFSFPEKIHILEHLDRLIEIFNVCWPMYAAMPAVLKDAVVQSYEDAGWDIETSTNKFGRDYYPNFDDVKRNIRTIIDSSEYDNENKGAYKGSLITRLKDLSVGLNGLIFTDDEIACEDLFDKNVIIDLSRVGSSETKSLLMGILVLKLQEYRMAKGDMNAELKHVTVLEEAHNLLKRTSQNFSQDSGNLAGKSVEMLTNSIAEMRTYGEGFIIADQAPALLDMAVIRNTNTKIIMRLPDADDRQLVGKAANINKEEQIAELAKLPCGVAAVYQNEWIEPVLCKIDKVETEECHYEYEKPEKKSVEIDIEARVKVAEIIATGKVVENEKEKEELKGHLKRLNLSGAQQVKILKLVCEQRKESPTRDGEYAVMLFPSIYKKLKKTVDNNLLVEKELGTLITEQLSLININDKTAEHIKNALLIHLFWIEKHDEFKCRELHELGVL